MSEATEELERRTIELYTDLNEVFKATPRASPRSFWARPWPTSPPERCCSRPPPTCSRHSTTFSTR